MRRTAMLVAVLAACTSSEPQPQLALDGPARVKVDTLGKVDGPHAVGPEGVEPEGLVWSVTPDHVARVEDGQVIAIGRGEAMVTGNWHDQQVQWELVVEPTVTLAFDDPPAEIEVGDRRKLAIQATIGGQPAIPVSLDWSVEPDGIAVIDEDGVLEARAAGTIWVTAKHGTSEAMAEIDVVPADPEPANAP